jgi:ankyrin repeat protein
MLAHHADILQREPDRRKSLQIADNCSAEVMANPNELLLDAFDGHDVDGVRAALESGADACREINGKLPIHWLLEQYWRSDRLPLCLRLLLEYGATLADTSLIPVLLDDAERVKAAIHANPSLLTHQTTLVSSFTSLVDVTLLHIAAEYGNFNAACALIELGADVNAPAGFDEYGLNGHTALFHTVNSNRNRAEPIMRLLLQAGASVEIRLKGVWWGKGYQWETVFFDVTPISYAQMGLLPQVHRTEADIYSNIKNLIEVRGDAMPLLNNVPNRYLK